MPRATRYLEDGYLFHLTHRCSNGEFFLRFAKERDAYREWLRAGVNRYKVPVLGYAITGNHTHIVVEVCDRLAVADMMKLASGVVAQSLNLRKGHEGSVWEHPYQCTRVQNGTHLLNCLRYIDLNMVRAGKVDHPSQWRWCGYDELLGKRRRYRIIDLERLCVLAGFASVRAFAEYYADSVTRKLERDRQVREPYWTEAVAVGSRKFVEDVEKSVACRQRMHKYTVGAEAEADTWAVSETSVPYNPDFGQKSAF